MAPDPSPEERAVEVLAEAASELSVPGWHAPDYAAQKFVKALSSAGLHITDLTGEEELKIAMRALHRINGGGSPQWCKQSAADAINEIGELRRLSSRDGVEEKG